MAHLRIPSYRVCVFAILLCGVSAPIGRADLAPKGVPVVRSLSPVNILFRALSRCRATLSERERWRIAAVIHRESQRFGYDPLFVVALAEVESTCLPTARSPRGALGLIQIRPWVARAVAKEAGLRWRGTHMLTKPLFNVHLGLRYLAQLEEQLNDPYLAVAAYNLGPGRVAGMPRWHARRAEYVRKVLSRYEALLAQHRPAGSGSAASVSRAQAVRWGRTPGRRGPDQPPRDRSALRGT